MLCPTLIDKLGQRNQQGIVDADLVVAGHCSETNRGLYPVWSSSITGN